MRFVLVAAALASSCAIAACSLVVDTQGLASHQTGGADEAESGANDAAADGTADDGATTDADADVTVDAGDDAAITTLARDTFSRVTASGWGLAEVGGVWSVVNAATSYTVTGGAGVMTLATAGSGPEARLISLSTDDADIDLVVSADKLGGGSGLYLAIVGRAVGASRYLCKIILKADGTFNAEIDREVLGTAITLAPSFVTASIVAGERIHVRLQVTGTQPTHLRTKVWKATLAEPVGWTAETVDSFADLQTKGTIGVGAYLSSAATNAPIRVSVDDLVVRPASLLP